MLTASSTSLSLILIALGCLGVILSFLVPDRKKSLISLGMAVGIIVVGIFQWSSQSLNQFFINRRMQQIRLEQKVNFDALREKLKENAAAPATGTAGSAKKP